MIRTARRLGAICAVAAASLTATSTARAENLGLQGLELLAYLAGAVVVMDVAFTTYDVIQAARGELPSKGVCVAEAIVAAPQLALGAIFMGASRRDEKAPAITFTAWTAVLTAHGIWGATASDKESRASSTGALRGGPARASWSIGLVSRF